MTYSWLLQLHNIFTCWSAVINFIRKLALLRFASFQSFDLNHWVGSQLLFTTESNALNRMWIPIQFNWKLFQSSVKTLSTDSISLNTYFIYNSEEVKTVQACPPPPPLPPNFEVSCLIFEWQCRGLETIHQDLHQMFQHLNGMFEQIFKISFKISSGAWVFRARFQDARILHFFPCNIVNLKCSYR